MTPRPLLLWAFFGLAAGAGGPYTDSKQDVAILNHWIYVLLILVTICFDKAAHELRHWLEHRAHEHTDEHNYSKKSNPNAATADLQLRIYRRFQGEMMTLGFLAFVVWVNNFAGTFDKITESYDILVPDTDSTSDSSASSSDSSSSGSSTSDSSSSSLERRLTEDSASSSGSSSYAQYRYSEAGHCEPRLRLPYLGGQLLHQVEVVHFALFIGMAFYFIFITYVCNRMVSRFNELSRAEAMEALDREPITGPEKSAMVRFKRYQQLIINYIAKNPEVIKAQHKRRLKGIPLDEKHFFFTFFLENTSLHNVDNLVEFPVVTWAILFSWKLLLSLGLTYFCIGWRYVLFVTEVYFYLTTAYLCIRLGFYYKLSVGEKEPCSFWPHTWIDRVLSPLIGPGVLGFVPWRKEPRECHGLWCIQTMLFFHLQFVAISLTDNNFGPFVRDAGVFGDDDGWIKDVEIILFVVQIVILAIWAHYLLPYLLEAFSMPPWLADTEVDIIVQTFLAYPNGCDTATAQSLLNGPELTKHEDSHAGGHGGHDDHPSHRVAIDPHDVHAVVVPDGPNDGKLEQKLTVIETNLTKLDRRVATLEGASTDHPELQVEAAAKAEGH